MSAHFAMWLAVTPFMTITAIFMGCALLGLFAWIEIGVADCIGIKEACIFALIDVAIVVIAGLIIFSVVG